jgi:hypothetical protein
VTAAQVSRPPVLDLAAVRAHLGRYAGAPGELSIVSDLDWSGQRFPTSPDGLAHAVDYVRDLDVQDATGIYHRGTTVRPEARRAGRGRAEDSAVWLAVQLDVDYGKPGYAPDAATAHALVLAADVPAPSDWVSSGHGLYPVWALTEPTPDSPFLRGLVLDLHAAVAASFEAAGHRIDPGVVDAARVWRIPGTVNRKVDDAPARCETAAGVGSGKAFAASTLRRAVVARASVTMTPVAPAGPLATPDGGLRPAGRLFTLAQAQAYVSAHALGALASTTEGGRNHALNTAAVVVGHFVGGGFLSAAQATEILLGACPAGWDEPMPVRHATIRSGLRRGMLEPYDLVPDAPEPAPPVVSTLQPAQVPSAAVAAPSSVPAAEGVGQATAAGGDWSAEAIEEGAFRAELVKERRRARVREHLAAESVPPVEVLGFDAFLSTPKVEYLVPGMLWRRGCARVFGPPGGTKSFLVLDLALCIAAGVPWRGQDVGHGVVHYVMAEGQEVNAARTSAWLSERDMGVHGRLVESFRPVVDGVQLTPEGIAGYLPRVAAERPALIVLDTKARMMVGSVNDPRDNAALVRALDMLRRASGGCVLLVDHTGVHDTSRAKGDNTVEAAMDTEIRVTLGEGRVATAEVTRDKSAGAGTSWSYTLRTVAQAAVCEPVSDGAVGPVPFRVDGAWWDIEANSVPEKVAEKVKGKGSSAALDIYRLLAFVDGERGLTTAEIRSMLAEGPRRHEYSVITRGLGLLAKGGVTVVGATDARVLIAPAYVANDISAT